MKLLEMYRYKMRTTGKYTRCWLVPYIRSKLQSSKFRPIVAHLFTEARCNVFCKYCYFRYNKKGMTFETAMHAIDYLKNVGCRAFGFMGGEPLIRKDFVLKVVDYGTRNGFFVDLATNGLLMTEAYINQLGEAGIASINLAIDCVDEYPGLPKSLTRNKPVYQYLFEQRHKYGYLVFLNVNITSQNMGDVKRLTEIAHDNGLGIDYHITEAPIHERERKEYGCNEFLITEDRWEELDKLVDWLIEKNDQGYIIVNSKTHLSAMKDFVRGKTKPWSCRAGYNAIVIREDGSIVPCMHLYSSEREWGRIFDYKFDPERLEMQHRKCHARCMSTVHYQLCEAYKNPFVNDAWWGWNWK